MISRTANNKRSSPATYASDTMQTVQRKKKDTKFPEALYGFSIYSNIHISLYQKQTIRNKTSISGRAVTSKGTELRHRAIITITQTSILDPCYKNGIDAMALHLPSLVRFQLLVL